MITKLMIGRVGAGEVAHYTMDKKERAYLTGKATELAILIDRNNTRGRNRFFDFMEAIEIFKQQDDVTPKLVELIKMKESRYRDLLIEHNLWTIEIYESIRARVMTKLATV